MKKHQEERAEKIVDNQKTAQCLNKSQKAVDNGRKSLHILTRKEFGEKNKGTGVIYAVVVKEVQNSAIVAAQNAPPVICKLLADLNYQISCHLCVMCSML